MMAIWVVCSGVKSNSFCTVFRYSLRAPSFQNGGACSDLCTPRFIATAPATTPLRNTSARMHRPAYLGESHTARIAGLSSKLRLIGGQCHQHPIGGRRTLVSHHGLRGGRGGRVLSFPRHQDGAEHRQRQQGSEHHASPKREIRERTPKRGSRLARHPAHY